LSDPTRALRLIAGVWDNADLLPRWLEHHRSMGVASVVAMDFGSTDGSQQILTDPQWRDFVDVIDFSGLTTDTNQVMLDYARATWNRGWVHYIDPDEFLFTPSGGVDELVERGIAAAADVVVVPRFHMTGERSLAAGAVPVDVPDLTLRWCEQDMTKVMVDLASSARADNPGHEGIGGSQLELTGIESCLLHYPTRSYAKFAEKVDHADLTMSVNDYPEGFAFHWVRWIEIRNAGGLREEYLDQFLADGDVPQLITDGEYAREYRLATVKPSEPVA